MSRTALDVTPKNVLLIVGLGLVFMLGLSFFLPASVGPLGWIAAFVAGTVLGVALWAMYRYMTVPKSRTEYIRTPQQRRGEAEWYRNHNEQPIEREDASRERQPTRATVYEAS
ncbi:MAG: hypothetical protein RhofKO_13490 [Rhodothermales bacterium]